ncbi:MAG TPA: peptide methionine sulfoxide reductase [Epsilonproteobacteria bacterium]|nr:peptide methionine sulfoxide reductase [Campylobacterota bacterium]
MNETEFYTKLLTLPEGANDVIYLGNRYILRKETLLGEKLLKVYAERLDQRDVVSGNYYPTIKGGMLKPCEMSDKKVIDFVLNLTVL